MSSAEAIVESHVTDVAQERVAEQGLQDPVVAHEEQQGDTGAVFSWSVGLINGAV